MPGRTQFPQGPLRVYSHPRQIGSLTTRHQDEVSRELNYQDLTLAVVTAFSREMERLQNVAGTAVKTIRDKVIAHRERIEDEALPRATSPAMRAMPAWAWPTVQCIFLAASQGGERRRKTRRRWS